MKILIYGLPGSGKSTLAKPSAKLLGGVHVNADIVREKYEGFDKTKWDFSVEGRLHQAQRMKYICDGIVMSGKIAVADFVCPTEETRKEFSADFTVWMDTIKEGRFEDTNKLFEKPDIKKLEVDYHVSKWFDDTHIQLVPIVERFMKKQSSTTVGYSAWRMELDDVRST